MIDSFDSAAVQDALLRLGVATLIGSAIGLDRELREKPAGLRTHALVALGAALVTLISFKLGPANQIDASAVSRVIQGVIAGVGFLGGGAILKTGTESVSGLTTAASIWVVAALGVACGAGEWAAAAVALLLALAVLLFGTSVEGIIKRRFIARRQPASGEKREPGQRSS